MTTPQLTLISHHLCPYVQRVAIALREQQIPFERRNVDLAAKPDWFLELSPLGKVPVLVIDSDTVLFESSVIAQYVNDIGGRTLLPRDPLQRSAQLAWMEFASQLIGNIGTLYNAVDKSALDRARDALEDKLQRVETVLGPGVWFAGDRFTLVDGAFAPAFRYFDTIDDLTGVNTFVKTPRAQRWRSALATRPSVITAVGEDYSERLLSFLANRDSVIGRTARTRLPHQGTAA